MSDSEEEYVYSDNDENEFDEDEVMDDAEGAQGGDMSMMSKSSSSPSQKRARLGNLADGEIRLLQMSDIIEPMQSQVASTSDLVNVPPAAAAAMLRNFGWSQEKLLDHFWADSERVLSKAGVERWADSGSVSELGTGGDRPQRVRANSLSSSGGGGGNPQAAGSLSAAAPPETSSLYDEDNGLVLGLPAGYGGVQLPVTKTTVTCQICFCDAEPSEAVAAPCEHFFCSVCYREYLVTKISEGPSVVYSTCPMHKCSTLVPPEVWLSMLSPGSQGNAASAAEEYSPAELAQFRGKFSQMSLANFVNNSKQMRWCPGPGCDKIIMAGQGVSNVKCGPNGCGYAFCFRCGEEAHMPAGCDEMVKWTEKCQNESETANWILANTKRCPKCNTRIEKNQGCNHMTCSQCKYEFCWMCMGDWKDHGANTGGYYKCNKFDPQKPGEDLDDATRAKRELDRYLHFYKRYQTHHQSQAYAEKQLQQTERRMIELQETAGSSWIDVQYLKGANEMVIECRRTLKHTYVFGYYLAPTMHKELFEDMQESLERYTEVLSELTEKPIEWMVQPDAKSELINNTRCLEKFLHSMLQGCEDGLDSGASAGASSSSSAAAAMDDRAAEVKAP